MLDIFTDSNGDRIADWCASAEVGGLDVDARGLARADIGWYAFHRHAGGGYAVLWSQDRDAVLSPAVGNGARVCGRLLDLDEDTVGRFVKRHQTDLALGLSFYGTLYRTAPDTYESGLCSYRVGTAADGGATVTVYFDHTSELDMVSTKDRTVLTGLNATETHAFETRADAEAFVRADARRKFEALLGGGHDGFKDKLDENKVARRLHKAVAAARDTAVALGGGAAAGAVGAAVTIPFVLFPLLLIPAAPVATGAVAAAVAGPLLAPGLAVSEAWEAFTGARVTARLGTSLRPVGADDLRALSGPAPADAIPARRRVDRFDAAAVEASRMASLHEGGLHKVVELEPKPGNPYEHHLLFAREDGIVNVRQLDCIGNIGTVGDFDTDRPGSYVFGDGEAALLKVKEDGTRLRYSGGGERLVAVGLPGEPMKPYVGREERLAAAARAEVEQAEQAVLERAAEGAAAPRM